MTYRSPDATRMSRRRFVQGLALGGAVLGTGIMRPARAAGAAASQPGATISGNDFALHVAETPVNLTGAIRHATTVNGLLPGPILRCKQGDTVSLRVSNGLRVPTSIHWHGIVLPYQMDGVPGISFDGIAPGETFNYRFALNQSGTYWYHSHSRFQEQTAYTVR